MKVSLINALKDNYIFAITKDKYCVIVDPGDASVVKKFLVANNLVLSGILVTHHHKDHTAGINELTNVPVWGHYKSPCPHINAKINTEEKFHIPQINIDVKPIMTPGHTLCHITYVINNCAFVGDTLFSAGCGRIFEGNYTMMYQSLLKIKALNNLTLIYAAHEYTEQNLLFAKHVEPNNLDMQKHFLEVKKLRYKNLPSIPTTLKLEKKINPFLRAKSLTRFQELREKKDLWK